MTQEDINTQLYRPLKKGKEYNKYFQKSKGIVADLGNGNTKFTLDKMAEWAKKYAHQSQKIANVLQGKSLQQLVTNIHQFLYWHIQYKIDGSNQNLQSPNYAWQTRKTGTDCKSYSIFASTILLNLGVKHYLRRIKQRQVYPDAFTHVYVVVPIDQKTGSLSKGHYVIDATLKNNAEINYLEKDDKIMEPNLPVYGLAYPGQMTPFGMSGFFDDLGGLFDGTFSPSCWGGTYDENDYNQYKQLVTAYFGNKFSSLNTAMQSLASNPNNIQLVKQHFNDIVMFSNALYDQGEYATTHHWSSICSKNTVHGFKNLAGFYKQTANEALIPYMQMYFNVSLQTVTIPNNSYPFSVRQGTDGMKKHEFVRAVSVKKAANLTVKQNVNIPAFEFSTHLVDTIYNPNRPGPFNFNTFLNSLSNIIFNNVNTNDNNDNGDTGSSTTESGGLTNNNKPKPHNAGMGVGALLLGAAAVGTYFYLKTKK